VVLSMSWVKYFWFWRPYIYFQLSHNLRTHLAAPYLGPANDRRGEKNAVYAVEVWTLYVAVTVT